MDDRAEIVVEKHESSGLPRDIGATRSHGNADVGGLECGRVVDTVSGHRDNFASLLQEFDDSQLLLRYDASENIHACQTCSQLVVSHSQKFATGEQNGLLGKARFVSNRAGGDGEI